ncbi:MAG: hypothetical protein DA408_21065 [Bacteroidetes bacterium]|nr:MAG: hypothetical protein C7N36_12325 [Bacteroidota bacterium]PTM08154.1 MAG: hypothetical protein DA408_21065 [Bacteroidota bacterium]
MRDFLTIFIVLLIFGSCQKETQETLSKKTITEHLRSIAHDPESVEFVSVISIDTIFLAKSLARWIETQEWAKDYEEKKIAEGDKLEERKIILVQKKKTLDSLLVIAKETPSNEVHEYRYNVQYRAKNKLGALVLSNISLVLNPGLDKVLR